MAHAETKKNQKTIGTYCVMAPPELIYASGAVPVKLCSGNYTAFSIGDDIAPRDACPLVKAVAGFKQTGLMPVYEDCSMMIVPITCDCKKKIAGMLSERCEVTTLHIPATREDRDIEAFMNQLYDLIEKLENVTRFLKKNSIVTPHTAQIYIFKIMPKYPIFRKIIRITLNNF